MNNTSNPKPIRILYMEDDPGLAHLFQRKLKRAGYLVDIARNGAEGLAMYHSGDYDVLAIDQTMPVHNGLEVIHILGSQGSLPPTVMVTGTGNEQTAVEAMKLGANDYIVKDVDGGYLDLLPTVVERVLRQQRLVEEKQQAEQALHRRAAELEALVQVSAALRTAQTVKEILSIVLEQTTTGIIPNTSGAIFLVEPQTSDILSQVTYPPNRYPLSMRRHLGQDIIGHVAATGEVHISESLVDDPLVYGLPEEAHPLDAMGGSIVLPLRTQERNIGVMNIVLHEQRPFTVEEVQLLTAIADITANALHRALVVESLEAEITARTVEIRAEREKSETILRSVGDAIVMTNLEGEIQYVNAAFTALTGYTATEILGRRGTSLIKEQTPDSLWRSLQLALSQSKILQEEATIQRKDGRTYDAALTIAPMQDADGRLVGYVFSHRDISRLKDLDRARYQFITNVSHQLRTPMTTLQLSLYLMQKKKRPGQDDQHLQAMEKEVTRLIHLIEDILEITTLDSGQAITTQEPISLSAAIDDVLTHFQSWAEESGLMLSAMPIPSDLPVVKGDQARLIQALAELVENGIIFTPAGGQVSIEVEAVERERQLWVTISVQDTGPGLSPDEQEKVFERFFRGKLAESGHIAGAGLGLSIAHEILRAHGGQVTVESEVGKGSTFKIWLLADG
jgi:PAS domain S-box-containing protein